MIQKYRIIILQLKLIIYGNWYTRLFYKGFDTIYNYSKIKTYQIKYLNYADITANTLTLHGNSKYKIKYTSYLDIYVVILQIIQKHL